MTLIETLAVLALMVVVTGLLSEILLGTLRIFEQTRVEDVMRSDSELALQRLTSSLRATMTVNEISVGIVDVYVPARNASGVNDVDYGGLKQGDRLKFYRGDAAGNVDSSGTYLWETRQQQINVWTLPNVVTTGFTDCVFQALTVSGTTKGLRTSLTYASRVVGTRTVSASYTGEVTFRNLP